MCTQYLAHSEHEQINVQFYKGTTIHETRQQQLRAGIFESILQQHRSSNYNRASATHVQIYQAKQLVKPVSPVYAV